MKRALIFGSSLIAILLLFSACNLPANPEVIQRYVSGTQTAQAEDNSAGEPNSALDTTPSNPLPLTADQDSRCDLYSDLDLKVLLLDVYPTSTSLIIYVEFPEGVIGIEDGTNDGFQWEYTAILGEVQSLWCSLFEGEEYAGRLYCMLPLPKEYHNAAKPFSLNVNLCNEPIVSIPKQSVVVEELPAVGSSGGSSNGNGSSGGSSDGGYFGVYSGIFLQLINICGEEPIGAYEEQVWCDCMGGESICYEAFIEGNWICNCELP